MKIKKKDGINICIHQQTVINKKISSNQRKIKKNVISLLISN